MPIRIFLILLFISGVAYAGDYGPSGSYGPRGNYSAPRGNVVSNTASSQGGVASSRERNYTTASGSGWYGKASGSSWYGSAAGTNSDSNTKGASKGNVYLSSGAR